MPAPTFSVFSRIFPKHDLFKGQSRLAFLWGAVAAGLLFLWLLVFYLLIDIGLTQGKFRPGVDQIEHWPEFARNVGAVVMTAPEATGDEPATPVVSAERLEKLQLNTGILPTVWRSREQLWSPLFAALYRYVPSLKSNQGAVLTLMFVLVIVSLARSWVLSLHSKAAHAAGLEVATRLRQRLHRQVLRLGPSDLDPESHQHAFNLFTRDVGQVQSGVRHWVEVLTRAPIELALLLLFAALLDFRMAFQILVPLLACAYLVDQAIRRSRKQRALAEDKALTELRIMGERFQKTRLVRGYRMEEADQGRFNTYLQRYAKEIAHAVRHEGGSLWISRVVLTICMALVLFLLLNRILLTPESFPLSVTIVLLASFAAMSVPLARLWNVRSHRTSVSDAGVRIHTYLDRTPEVSQAVGAKFMQPLATSITFESTTCTPPGGNTPLLKGIDLKIPAGQMTAIVSMNPSESRALVSLLTRYLEPKTGRVLFDGEDINWATLESLRAEAIMVDAVDPVFTGTVLENLTCGDENYTLMQVTDATKQVHAHQFISKLPQGYETVLGERGATLSAGEGFLLSLARAVLRNPALLIIEEPEVPLDDDTKGLLDDAYNRVLPGRTTIFLPSRLSTLRRCQSIVVLNQGKVFAVGPHAQLVQKVPLYRHWEYIRFNEFRSLTPEESA